METVVLGLGGNALMDPSNGSLKLEMRKAKKVAGDISRLDFDSVRLIITHGNGPQVGNEILRGVHARRYVRTMPLHLMTAETQATLGSVLELAIKEELEKRGADEEVSVMLTHVEVDARDGAFSRPTKPVGPVYSGPELRRELRYEKFKYVAEGGGFRRVVASPVPVGVVEARQIREASRNGIVIACGGGGIPVVRRGKGYSGAGAVIDKDRTTGLLARLVRADRLVLLTNVDYVYSVYPDGPAIRSVSAETLRRRLGSFEEGTMRPKISACIDFVRATGSSAFIGNIGKLSGVIAGDSGTRIYR